MRLSISTRALSSDRGVSMDHIVFGYLPDSSDDTPAPPPDEDWVRRRELTMQLAAEFFAEVARRGTPLPIGAAHGWDRASYQRSVDELQQIGFTRISLGGMVPLKTRNSSVVEAVGDVRSPRLRSTYWASHGSNTFTSFIAMA